MRTHIYLVYPFIYSILFISVFTDFIHLLSIVSHSIATLLVELLRTFYWDPHRCPPLSHSLALRLTSKCFWLGFDSWSLSPEQIGMSKNHLTQNLMVWKRLEPHCFPHLAINGSIKVQVGLDSAAVASACPWAASGPHGACGVAFAKKKKKKKTCGSGSGGFLHGQMGSVWICYIQLVFGAEIRVPICYQGKPKLRQPTF